jgi:hypothetical protein
MVAYSANSIEAWSVREVGVCDVLSPLDRALDLGASALVG